MAKKSYVTKLAEEGSFQWGSGYTNTATWTNSTSTLLYQRSVTVPTLLKWFRFRFSGWDSAATYPTGVLIGCVRKETADALPVIWTADVVETLKRDGKLFYLKPHWFGKMGTVLPRWIELEFKNVRLREGESLTVFIYNCGVTVNGTGTLFYTTDERILTI